MTPGVWHLAICLDCKPILPQPFTDPKERERWVEAHSTTGHRVDVLDLPRS